MLYLKCTAIVRKTVGLKDDNLLEAEPSDAPLGNWYVHRFKTGRRNVFIFMSEETLLSFVLLQGKKPVTLLSLPHMMLAGLEQLLTMRGLSEIAIKRALEPYEAGLYAKTDNRSSLGSLNDLINCYKHCIDIEGGLEHCDLTGIIMQLNEMPQRKLDWHSSWDIAQSKLCTS